SRFARSVAGATSMSSVTTGAPARRAAAAPIRTYRTPCSSSARRISSGSGAAAGTIPQRAERPPRRQTAPQSLCWRPSQLAVDQHAVVVARICSREPEAELEPAPAHELAQTLEARNHLVALV